MQRNVDAPRFARLSRVALTVLALLAAACGDARRTITGQNAQFSLRVNVQPSAAITAVGQALAWPPGTVPGARVIATRISSDPSETPSVDTAVADAFGVARFSTLALARYTVRASRTFSAGERVLAAPGLGDAEELVGLSTVLVTADSAIATPIIVTPIGGSALVISEVYPAWPVEPSGQQYYVGGYLELHNNSDTTIALAGKLFLDVWDGYLTAPTRPDGCSIFSAVERDPQNVWVQQLYRFPVDARSLESGQTAVLATDGIDHRPFGRAGFFDLTIAAAEFPGSSDVDSPLVPNMIDLSPRPREADGHGWRFRGGRQYWAIANGLRTDTLARWTDAVFGTILTRVPVSALLDLVRFDFDEPMAPGFALCPSAIAGSVDPSDAVLLRVEDTLAIRRRVSRTLPNGRVIYQRSRNSAADWISGKATPGLVP
jgi:hypothetical protein